MLSVVVAEHDVEELPRLQPVDQVDRCRLDGVGLLLGFDGVTEDQNRRLGSVGPDVEDSLMLRRLELWVIGDIECVARVCECSIASTLAYVEHLRVARVAKQVDKPAERVSGQWAKAHGKVLPSRGADSAVVARLDYCDIHADAGYWSMPYPDDDRAPVTRKVPRGIEPRRSRWPTATRMSETIAAAARPAVRPMITVMPPPPAQCGTDRPGEAGVAERDGGRHDQVEYREYGEETGSGDGGVSESGPVVVESNGDAEPGEARRPGGVDDSFGQYLPVEVAQAEGAETMDKTKKPGSGQRSPIRVPVRSRATRVTAAARRRRLPAG